MRVAAYRSLGLRGEPDAVRPLEGAPWYEEDAEVRRVRGLAQLGTPEAVDGLLVFLEQYDGAAAVDLEAILSAIGTISTPESDDVPARAVRPRLPAWAGGGHPPAKHQ